MTLADFRINEFSEVRLQPLVRTLLVLLHETRIAGHIGDEDGGSDTGGLRRDACIVGTPMLWARSDIPPEFVVWSPGPWLGQAPPGRKFGSLNSITIRA